MKSIILKYTLKTKLKIVIIINEKNVIFNAKLYHLFIENKIVFIKNKNLLFCNKSLIIVKNNVLI